MSSDFLPQTEPVGHEYKTNIDANGSKFTWVGSDEPHASRRRLILEKYPEVKNLYGTDIWTFPKILFWVTLNIIIAIWLCSERRSWFTILTCSYICSGTINHVLLLAMHEVSHNLCFQIHTANKILAIFANLTQGVPSAVSFRRYHMEHHTSQGIDGMDTDLPTEIEGYLFTNPISKFLFVLFQSFFYAVRPMVVRPKQPAFWEFVNISAIISFNTMVYFNMGPVGNIYFTVGTLLGMGLHPLAGHFIAEHYEVDPETKGYTIDGGPPETFSYYGSGNLIGFNVGYHNEHHDFPMIPGSRLPEVKSIAPEFYDTLKCHNSWSYVLWSFITNSNVDAKSRIKRHRKEE